MSKYKFRKKHKDQEVSYIQRELEDNFIALDKNGNVVIDGNIKCNELFADFDSVHLGSAKIKNVKNVLYLVDEYGNEVPLLGSTNEIAYTPTTDYNPATKSYVDSGVSDATDNNAIHDNVDAEINAVSEKVSPVNADLVLIEDSESSNEKKKVQVGNLPGGAGGGAILLATTYDESATNGILLGAQYDVSA